MKIIDLSHPLTKETPHFPGDDPFELTEEQFGDITISAISTSLHVGTHIDLPRHMMNDVKTVKDMDLDHFMGKAVVIDDINTDLDSSVQEGFCVLIRTGHSAYFHDAKYYQDYPEIPEDFMNQLIARKVKLIGLETPSPDKAPYRIHQKLFKQGILIVENLAHLERLPMNEVFDFYAIPLKIDAEASMVRAFAVLK